MGYLSKKTKEEFRQILKEYCDSNDPEATRFPPWMRKDFFTYWCAKNEGGRLMYFQMEKKWNTGLRLATWKRNCQRDPRWKEQEKASKPSNIYPGSFTKHSPQTNGQPKLLVDLFQRR